MGLRGLEPPTSRLSGVRSNQLSYNPMIRQPPAFPHRRRCSIPGRIRLNHRVRDVYGCFPYPHHHRKCIVLSLITSFCSCRRSLPHSRKACGFSRARSRSYTCPQKNIYICMQAYMYIFFFIQLHSLLTSRQLYSKTTPTSSSLERR